MNLRLSTVTGLVLALSALAAAVPAQRGEEGPVPARRGKKEMTEREIRAAKERTAAARDAARAEAARVAAMSPEEKLEHGTRRGATQHLQFTAVCKPSKLMPGQTGTVMISASLKGAAVLEAPARIQILNQVGQSPVILGELSAHPASMGTLAKAYMGRPVYDNTAIFEVPVTMNGDIAQMGDKHVVAFDVKFDLHDGTSGNAVGRFIERISAPVEVGQELDPPIKPARSRKTEQPIEAAPEKPAPKEPETAQPEPDDGVLEGAQPADVADPEPVDPKPEGNEPVETLPDSSAESDGLPMPLLLGGGGLLLVVIVLMLARKK